MKFLKYLLYVVLGLVALVLIIALILPKDFHAGSEIVINKSREEVFDYVKYLKNQGDYDNWSSQDPDIIKNYQGTDGTVGFTYTWQSKKVGDGKQVITGLEEGKRIEMDLYFNGSEDANPSSMTVEEISPDSSKVTWIIDGKIPYLFNIMCLFYDMNADFDKGLQNLKTILEKQ